MTNDVERADRFWAKIDRRGPDECWPLKACLKHRGYGSVTWKSKKAASHRIAYTLANGEIPPGMFVCHSCDNPPCCNPAHLWVGTPADNARDMLSKGRHVRPVRDEAAVKYRRGEACTAAKLSGADIATILRRRKNGNTYRAIAHDYGVHFTLIYQIAAGKIWKSLKHGEGGRG